MVLICLKSNVIAEFLSKCQSNHTYVDKSPSIILDISSWLLETNVKPVCVTVISSNDKVLYFTSLIDTQVSVDVFFNNKYLALIGLSLKSNKTSALFNSPINV